jgi:TPR repeat protein
MERTKQRRRECIARHLVVAAAMLVILSWSADQAFATIPVMQQYSPQQVEDFEKRAAKGDADAQASLADGYMHGIRPLKPDEDKAYEWLVKAANGGNAWAEANLGWFYDKGKHVAQDYRAAMKWYLKAADQQYPAAEDMIGKMYRDGRGVQKDYAVAAEWFQKAADQINSDAAIDLGFSYATGGPNLRPDFEKAYFWFNIRENDAWPNIMLIANEMTSEIYDDNKSYEDGTNSYKSWVKHLTSQQMDLIKKRVKEWRAPAKTKWMHPGSGHFTLPHGHYDCVMADGSACPPDVILH